MNQKIIVVIGAGAGFGNHIAKEFGEKGFQVILMARREEALKKYIKEFEENGIKADYEIVDCSKNQSIQDALIRMQKKYGAIEILSYNAAVLKDGFTSELSPEEMTERYQVDVAGALCAVQQVLPEMKKRKEGTILMTGVVLHLILCRNLPVFPYIRRP